MTFKFVCQEHKEFGCIGWRLKAQPDFDPLSGVAVAHDCLEHFSDSPNPADEFLALGASMWLRNDSYYNYKGYHYTNPGYHISADMPEILRHVVNEGYSLAAAPRTVAIDDDGESGIDTTFHEYRKNLKDENDGEDLKLDSELERSIRSYLRLGYRRANKRYKGRNWEAQQLFCQIEKQSDKDLKHAEEGSELHISVNFKEITAKSIFLESWEIR